MEEKMKKEIGQRIYDLTKNVKGQRKFLQDILERSNAFITNLFYGKATITSADIIKLSQVLGVSADYILGLSEKEEDLTNLRIKELESKINQLLKHLGVNNEE